MKKTISFLIIGPQGAGKGTQAKILAKKLNLAYFSMGEELKKIRDSNTKLGKKGRYYYDRGLLWPETLVKQVFVQAIKRLDLKNGIVFEGYPRTLYQVKMFNPVIKKYQIETPWVIYLKVSQKTVWQRIAQRKICPSCGRAFYPQDKDYKKQICLKCKQRLITRPDDSNEVVKKRLNVFKQKTKPLIDYYQKQNRLIEINGELSIKEVTKEIFNKLKTKGII